MTTAADVAKLIATRYSDDSLASLPAAASETIALQLRHRSVRKFTDQPISEAELTSILAAGLSASVSSNLQLFSVVTIRDRERMQRISAAIGGHPYVESAEVFLVWVVDLHRAVAMAEAAEAQVESLPYLENTLVGFVDCGIAAQNTLLAAESLGMGGVFVGSVRNNPVAVAEELNLPPHVFPAFGMSLGWPDPSEQAGIKPRVPMEAVVHHENYGAEAWREPVVEYESRLAGYYANYGKPDYSWQRTILGRIGAIKGLHGREQMREWLTQLGLESR
ncbi:NADPH-dependent oxidoreductase [Gulosibacter hominis]|uniref:NADPH-dependent oxidoreductase n=1 Tax=Gulosibacter hominis TaxID=2770504 RepID=UPI001917B909|nr:NADPH-dependent oxidoreductase [Gulosibacter hominis]